MALDEVKNGVQCCFSNFDSGLFRCTFFVKAVSILLLSFTLGHYHKPSPKVLQEISPIIPCLPHAHK